MEELIQFGIIPINIGALITLANTDIDIVIEDGRRFVKNHDELEIWSNKYFCNYQI